MGKPYCQVASNPSKTSLSRAWDIRCHYKNTRETTRALKGMKLKDAKRYLREVIAKRRCIPYRRHNGGVPRQRQAAEFGFTQGRWPRKSVVACRTLLKNAEANAESKGLDTKTLHISHIMTQKAQKQRRRTYRAHGRINPYMSSPCHIELILTSKEAPVKPPAKE
eukprot:TRINITY_DN5874_c0_g1_i1.p1 TRINITY_DN5874_c0_g1~~TRINITY_DN5874_c0_g1_i1.p1  ORF type:complete len:165 (+),score=17.64 TRINITY_DN5874_c0_g1_i1:63-557(+)